MGGLLAPLLTPLLYAASAVVGVGMARRWLVPISASAAVVLALLPLCLTGRALLAGRVYAPVDLVLERPPFDAAAPALGIDGAYNQLAWDIPLQIVPWHRAVRDAWSAGEWPLWNPSLLAGDVLAAAAQPAPYHPFNLLSLALPLDLALTFLASVILFTAGLGAFVFARDLGCREESALLAAAAWALSSFVVFWLLWPMGVTAVFLPLVLAGARRVAREVSGRHIGLLAAGFVLVLLAGHPESVLYVVTAGALYGAWEVVVAWRELARAGGSRRVAAAHAGRAVAGSLVAAAVALGLGAVFLLPLLDALPETFQYALRRTQFANQDHSVPWREALGRLRASLVPFAHGVSWGREGRIPVPGFFVPPSSAYLGSVLLAPIAFGVWRHPWPGRWILAAFAVIGALAGAALPGVTHALAALPVFELSIHKRWVFVAAGSLAVLAGLGAEAWAARPDRRARREMLVLHAAVLAGLLGLLVWSWPGMLRAGLSQGFLLGRSLLLIGPVLASAALFAWVRVPRTGLILFVALLLAQRTGEAGDRYPTLERGAFFPEPPILAAIPRDEGPFRVVATGDLLPPNTACLYGLEDVRGYEPMALRRYIEASRLWTDEADAYFYRVDSLEHPFLDFLGVRFALAPDGMKRPPRWRPIAADGGVALLENRRALPRAFVPEVVHLDRPRPAMWRQMERARDFWRVAWIETAEPATAGAPRRESSGPGTVELEAVGSALALRLRMDDAGWVVTSLPAWPGWRAVIEGRGETGRELPLAHANHAFVGFHLGAGEHRVVLRYRPRSFVVGRAVSVGTGVALVAWAALAGWRRRKTRAV